jgi:transcriptional regulator with XRE-family HTH domain
MQKHLEEIEVELVKRIYKEFLLKFNGNKSEFARAAKCSETTVRRVFRNEQRMTVDLLLRFCVALGIEVNEFFNGIRILNRNDSNIE